MDVYCPRCAEPWDLDCLHDEVSERWPNLPTSSRDSGYSEKEYERRFNEVRADFTTRGCAALGEPPCRDRSAASAVIAAAYELNGDDIDGAASMLADAESLGLL